MLDSLDSIVLNLGHMVHLIWLAVSITECVYVIEICLFFIVAPTRFDAIIFKKVLRLSQVQLLFIWQALRVLIVVFLFWLARRRLQGLACLVISINSFKLHEIIAIAVVLGAKLIDDRDNVFKSFLLILRIIVDIPCVFFVASKYGSIATGSVAGRDIHLIVIVRVVAPLKPFQHFLLLPLQRSRSQDLLKAEEHALSYCLIHSRNHSDKNAEREFVIGGEFHTSWAPLLMPAWADWLHHFQVAVHILVYLATLVKLRFRLMQTSKLPLIHVLSGDYRALIHWVMLLMLRV